MRLSEAIRLGAMLKPQGFCGLFTEHRMKTCAIGAAMEATGMRTQLELQKAFPILEMRLAAPLNLARKIVELNDIRCWPRERIADYVAETERLGELMGIRIEWSPPIRKQRFTKPAKAMYSVPA